MTKKADLTALPLPPAKEIKAGSWGHASGRIWYREKKLLGRSGLDRLYAAFSEEEVKRLLIEHDYPQKERGRAMVEAEREEVYRLLEEISPQEAYRQVFLLPGDGQNLKAALKYSQARGDKDPETFRSLMTRPSLLDHDLLWQFLVKGEGEEALAEWASSLVGRALEAFRTSCDPADIDRSIDRDLHRMRADLALSLKDDWLVSYLAMERDLVNLEALLRARQRGSGPDLLKADLLPEGAIRQEDWLALAGEKEEKAKDFLAKGPYKGLARYFATYGDRRGPALYSRDRDRLLYAYLAGGVKTLSGPARVIAYVMARESEFKNIRLALAALVDGLDREAVRTLRRDF